MYEIFKKLCEKNGVSSADVARATGVAKATTSVRNFSHVFSHAEK